MATKTLIQRLSSELGFKTLANSTRDVYILLLTRFIRMFAYGSSTLILAIYFAALGHSDTKIGLFMTLTLIGDVGVSLALTFVADSLGRRKILILGALLMTASGIVFATTSNFWILLIAAVVGVISPSGNEIGPFRAVEESTLAHLSDAATRSDIFAWYVIFGTLGTASGSLTCGWATQALQNSGWNDLSSYRVVFWIYALIGLIKASLNLLLSPRCEAEPQPTTPSHSTAADDSEEEQPFISTPSTGTLKPPPAPKTRTRLTSLSPSTLHTLLKLCFLFTFDSLASGMVPASLIALYISRKFSTPAGTLGTIMSVAAFASTLGNLFASAIAKRIGLVRTMVFTHLPSAILLSLIPAPSNLALTIVLLILRSSLASMDQAPRSAFLAAVVLPNERTAVMGVVNTVKTAAQSSGPVITGVLAQGGRFWIAFVVAGGLKGGYDLGMLGMFSSVKLEGEGKKTGGEGEGDGNEEDGMELEESSRRRERDDDDSDEEEETVK